MKSLRCLDPYISLQDALTRPLWSIFRLPVAKFKCGDECQREVLFLPVQTRLVLSGSICPQSESLVYSALAQ